MKFFLTFLACMVAAASAYPTTWGYWGNHWGGAPLGADGRVVDTPEVAHAKAAHFAAKAAATHGAWDNGHWNNGYWNNGWNQWNGHAAHVALTPDAQYLRDTPAVAHAKAAHAVAHASAAHRGDYYGYNNYAYGYPHHW